MPPEQPNLTRPLPSLVGSPIHLEIALCQDERGQVWQMQRHDTSGGWMLMRFAYPAELVAFASQGQMVPDPQGYRIGAIGRERWIWCAQCSLVSFNLYDVEQKYCGHCHRFLEGH